MRNKIRSMITFRDRLQRTVESAHLAYLGLLPALATFAILSTQDHPFLILIFLGGTVVVSVYLATVISYAQVSNSLSVAFFILLDGPLCAALAQPATSTLFAFAIDSFMVDGVAIWLAIVWLAVTTSRPTKAQRMATIFFALVAVSTVAALFWPYLRETVWGQWRRLFWLTTGIGEAVMARYYLLEVDEVTRAESVSGPYIVVFLLIWIVAMVAGSVIYATSG